MNENLLHHHLHEMGMTEDEIDSVKSSGVFEYATSMALPRTFKSFKDTVLVTSRDTQQVAVRAGAMDAFQIQSKGF